MIHCPRMRTSLLLVLVCILLEGYRRGRSAVAVAARLRVAALPSAANLATIRSLKRQAKLFARFEHSIESEQREAPAEDDDAEFTGGEETVVATAGAMAGATAATAATASGGRGKVEAQDRQWNVVSTTVPIDHSKPFVETITQSRPWRITPEVPRPEAEEQQQQDIPAAPPPRGNAAGHTGSWSGKPSRNTSGTTKTEPVMPIAEPTSATIIMRQVRRADRTQLPPLPPPQMKKKKKKKKKKKNRTREKAVSSELQKIIETSAAKYGGATALTLEEDDENEEE